MLSAITAPVANTGVFILLAWLFIYNNESIIYVITAFVGLNFVVELIVNMVLIPSVLFIIKFAKKV